MLFQKFSKKILAIIFLSLILSVFSGLQFFGQSKDAEQYRLFFENIDSELLGRFEPLFQLATLYIKSGINNFSFYLFVLCITSLYLKFYVLKNFRNFKTSILLYLLILFPLHELTQIRVSLALSFIYLSLLFLYQKNDRSIRVALLFIAAILFHYSTLIFFPIILFWRHLKNRKPIFWVFLGALFLMLIKLYIIEYSSILNPTLLAVESTEANIFSSRNILLFLVLLIGAIRWKEIMVDLRPFWFISLYGFVLWGIFYDAPVFAHRFFEMTFFSYFIWTSTLRGASLWASRVLLVTLAIYQTYKNILVDPLFT